MSKLEERPKTLRGADGEKEQRDPALNEKRKRAMVGYLAIMFFVAFLLVALSLFVQNRNLRQASNDSLTLQGKLENLQTENRELRETLAQYLLEDAQQAYDSGDAETFSAAMEQLSAYAESLNAEGKAAYDALCAEYQPAAAETEP